MKLSLIIALCILVPVSASAAPVIHGKPARDIMEALQAAGFKVKNLDSLPFEASAAPFSIHTGRIECSYSNVFPDQWIGGPGMVCAGEGGVQDKDGGLKNSLALAKALLPIAPKDAFDGALSKSILKLSTVDCVLAITQRETMPLQYDYSCTLTK